MSNIIEEKDPVKLLVDLEPDIRKPADGRVRSTEEMMFGAESQAAVSAAVRRAVERADALGLPRAYKELPAMDLNEGSRYVKKS
jgi:hypothetical protein